MKGWLVKHISWHSILYLLISLFLGGCASASHVEVYLKWSEVYNDAYTKAEEKSPLAKNDIVERLGPPDLIVLANDWRKAIPNEDAQASFMYNTFPESISKMLSKNEIEQTIYIMFYDEHKRYLVPAAPTWGMGMGWQLTWFVLNGDTVIGSGILARPKPQLSYDGFTESHE